MDLYFLNYNNYYNRQVKIENSLSDYINYMKSPSPIQQVNFVPGDGINTEQVINWEYDTPDYLVCVDEYGNIDSRWFVIEFERTRGGQYKALLHRDVVADHYDVVIKAPCFIEKATVGNDDPAVYNSEDMTFNQIKKSETLLKDYTGCPWIVGYFARGDAENSSKSYSAEIASLYPPDIEVKDSEGNLTTLDQWEYYDYYINFYAANPTQLGFRFNYGRRNTVGGFEPENQTYTYVGNSFNWTTLNSTSLYTERAGTPNYFGYLRNNNLITGPDGIVTIANRDVINVGPSGFQSVMDSLNGLLIKYLDSEGNPVIKKIVKSTGYTSEKEFAILNSGDTKNLFNAMYQYALATDEGSGRFKGVADGQSFRMIATYQSYSLSLIDTLGADINIKVDIPSRRYHLQDSPYDMFCLPYSDKFEIYLKDGSTYGYKSMSQQVALNIGSGITGDLTSSVVYDIQLLPYCPIRGLQVTKVGDTYKAMFNDQAEADLYGYSLVKTTSASPKTVGFILYAASSSFTFDIPLENPIIPTNYKVSHLTDKYRLCSPNYNGVFEFSAAANDGIHSFNVDCTYLPQQPYIHINPDFGGLYGQDFNGSRGLVAGGEFSLPQTSEAWQNYLLQNKNYLNSFNRQIENMEVNNYYSNVQAGASVLAGGLSGGVSGAMTGALAGGPIGAAIGGVLGGAASLGAGAADMYIRKQLQVEALDYTKDQFGYQLGNIKAMPTSLSRVTAYTYNNKIFPFLEYYTCTETEKQALKDKLKYNGMTVGRIGTISEFLQPDYSYIKGKIIRLEDENYSDDMHMSTAISDEIYKGVFIK